MNKQLDPNDLLAVYNSQVRAREPWPLPEGVTVERDGPLLRILGLDHGGFLTYQDLGGLSGEDLDLLIARQRAIFTARGEQVEWKLHGHDEPADLADRLAAAGFVPEELETVLVGPAAPLAATAPKDIPGVRLREVTSRADLDRIARMEDAVWGGDPHDHLAEGLEKELAADPDGVTVIVAEHGDLVVSAGWIRYVPGTGFAGLWGGSTLEEFRGRGVYKALVAYRAVLAVARGYEYLQVDASPDSRPILERLGFVTITTTTPYVFKP